MKKIMNAGWKKRAMVGLSFLVALGIIFAFLLYNGVLLLNNPSRSRYPVRGVDVSSYQGEIDWPVLEKQDIQFAFIKATEGSTFVDPYFQINFEKACKTSLRIGAYHFFSYDSAGKTQAENFIATVPAEESLLQPVADVEFYGDKERHLPDKAAVTKELQVFLSMLESHYGKKPIIYATEKSYRLFIAGTFDAYDIWIRNVVSKPSLSDKRAWTFWQYTNREKLDGYRGKETFIDMNVFDGSPQEFEKYGRGENG